MAICADEVAALLLAGGQSRRFGSNKAHAYVDGLPMINHVYNVLDACFPSILISTATPDIRFAMPAQHIADPYANTGPLGGIYAGMMHAQQPWLFVSAVDLPRITSAAVHQILNACHPDIDGVIATDGNHAQPLFGCYHTRLKTPLNQFLQAGERAVFRFIEAHAIQTTEMPAEVLTNVNYPDDLPSGGEKFQANG